MSGKSSACREILMREIGTIVPVKPAFTVGKMSEWYPKVSPDFLGKW
jgi:hypothetical protein